MERKKGVAARVYSVNEDRLREILEEIRVQLAKVQEALDACYENPEQTEHKG